MSKILGLDLSSTNIGWAIINEKTEIIDFGLIPLAKFKKKKFPLEYLKIAYQDMSFIIKKHNPNLVMIEATFCRNVLTLKSLAQMRGVASIACINNGVLNIKEISPSSCRKKVFGNGALKKEEVYKKLKEKYKEDIFNSGYDISDAIVIALSGIEKGPI